MNQLQNNYQKNLSLLVVEDNQEDYVALTRIMRKLDFQYPIYHCEDGDEALDFLFQTGEYSDPEIAPRPTIILIDLNLPGTDGREVIKVIKNNQQLKKIPVVVFSTSSNPQDIHICYQQGANSYMQKPVNIKDLSKNIEIFLFYWFQAVILPYS
ncbi:MAG: response regulator [Okeania sp. SIO3I5]|uniref:response regulator n=1 Tax=Okeania sp. SIO3I5 TaxID=2607805 RepID=UPI0013BAC228|nr:response regulator [Okeania sp. SIO3I5]NEQ40911.1 response regulator [Okeania sp. SIO3I5]